MTQQSGEESNVILYVDDDYSNRVVFEQCFSGPFEVLTAASAEQAIEILERRAIAVIVTDQRMPGLRGNELLDAVKQRYPDVVRFVITAYSDSQPLLEAVNQGLVARYFIKPWDLEELKRSLEWAVDAHRLTKQNSALQMRLLETERLATLGIVGSGMLHDLKQPLAFMVVNAKRLQQLAAHAVPAAAALMGRSSETLSEGERTWLGDLIDELPAIAGDMMTGTDTLHGMTQDLSRLLYPKPRDAGECRCNPVEVSRYTQSICRQIAVRHDARLTFDVPADLPAVAIRASELIQTLINLFKNAAEAVGRNDPSGGSVSLTGRAQDGRVRFVVSDDGPGIPPEVLDKIGRPFFTTRGEGTGLGVAQCKRLIEGAGGHVEITSEPGRGTTIAITLPVA